MKRKERLRFIQGRGNYVDDVNLPHMVYGHMVRSPYAHARIKSINTEAAKKLPGVLAIITVKTWPKQIWPGCRLCFSISRWCWPRAKSLFQAQEVAFVVAEDPCIAADAAELVEVDYEELPVLVDPHKATNQVLLFCVKIARKKAIISSIGK